MKTKLFIISLLVAATGLLVSCDRGLSEADLKNYINALKYYYPYSLNEEFIFENESLGQTWEALPYDDYNEGVYPYTHITICKNEVGSKCSGDRSAGIAACMIEKGKRDDIGYSKILTYLEQEGGHKNVFCEWRVSLLMSDSTFYTGFLRNTCPQDEVLSQLTDIITIPISYKQTSYSGSSIPLPEGAFARIVKGKGLTEFSLDGKTVWKRVIVELD